jgi:putative colanic acid biosynthesis acetyltransferase WcaF
VPARVFYRLDQARGAPYGREEYVGKLLWRVVQATLFRWGRPRHRARLLRMFGADVDPTVDIRGTVKIHHPWLLRMGRYSSIGENVHVYNLGPIVIGEQTAISQNAHLCAGTHDWRDPSMPLVRAGITIGSGTWVCADAFVGPGVRVGHNAIVAARAVVVADVPDGVIVGGNPARVLKARPMGDEPVGDGPSGAPAKPGAGEGAGACVSAS